MFFKEIVEIKRLLKQLEKKNAADDCGSLISAIKAELDIFNNNIVRNLRKRRQEIVQDAKQDAEKIKKQNSRILIENQKLIEGNHRLIEIEAELRSRIANLKNNSSLKKIQLENALIRYQLDCLGKENLELKGQHCFETHREPLRSQLFDW